uniref:Uncharacterized protein n=1 Tax=Nelumbo nucifera TaxID=4432 RepID=A0A822YST1_NELNU|nr:TPA_asm: hypothetical protein HUJ06_005271 [Nelumbo nucifera]
MAFFSAKNNNWSMVAKSVPLIILWEVWRERNLRRVENRISSASYVISQVEVEGWLHSIIWLSLFPMEKSMIDKAQLKGLGINGVGRKDQNIQLVLTTPSR